MGVKVRHKRGDVIQEDCSCDSEFMKETMKEVGQKIRDAFHWVSEEEIIYLVMDNAGGHGTDEAIQEYAHYLKLNHNIEIIHQCPRSACTNALDLGVWVCLQSAVEKEQYHKTTTLDSLAASVAEIWQNGQLDRQISNVFEKIQDILKIIIKDGGSIKNCETDYRKKRRNLLQLTDDDMATLETWKAAAAETLETLNDGGSDDEALSQGELMDM
jgi:uncharacterized coiled-coil protein SlyX